MSVCGIMAGIVLLAGMPAEEAVAIQTKAASRDSAQFGDLAAYWVSGRAVLERENPFDPATVQTIEEREGLHQAFPIWNPPWILPLVAMLAIFPFFIAAILFCSTNVALALWSGLSIGRSSGMTPFATVVATITFLPVLFCIGMSQWSIIVLAAVIGFDVERRAGRPYLAGVILAFAAIKPHLASLVWLVPLFLGTRRERVSILLGVSTTLLVLLGITEIWEAHLIPDYFQAIEHPAANAPTNYLAATTAVWMKAGLEEQFGTSLSGLQFLPAAIGLVGACFWLIQSRRNDAEVVPVLMLGSLLVLPYGWHYDQVLLLPIYLLLWSEVIGGSCRYRSLRLGIALVLLNAGMGWMAYLGTDESCYFLWPPALALIWLLGRHSKETIETKLTCAY